MLGLIGRNGAGKTTLMRILATAIKQTEGTVKFDDKDIFKHLKEYRAQLGYLPQTTNLMPTMNIYEFLDYMCVLKKISVDLYFRTIVPQAVSYENHLVQHYFVDSVADVVHSTDPRHLVTAFEFLGNALLLGKLFH